MISVIIPLFNKQNSIARCLQSVLSQSYGDFECIVVDDGSTDNGANIVKSYNDSRIKYFYKKNGGVSSARNFGVARARADKIVFLDADDYFLDEALKILNEGMTQNHTDCAAANFYIGKQKKKQLYSKIGSSLIDKPFKICYLGLFWPRAGNFIFSKKVLEKHPFSENLTRYEDSEALFNIMRENKFFFDSRPVMVYTDDYLELSHPCSNPNNDYWFHLDFTQKKFWEKLLLLRFLNQAYIEYPQNWTELQSLYGKKTLSLFLERRLRRILSIYRKMLILFFLIKTNFFCHKH